MTAFGEIVEPTSRTTWEDWDEILPEQSFAELQLQTNVESLEKVESFIIFEGKYLTEIVAAQSRSNLNLINSITGVNLKIYKEKTLNAYVCIVKDYELIQSSEIVELLRPYLIASKNVVALQTKALAEYQSSEVYNGDCVLRTVFTSNLSSKSVNFNYPRLEQPNILSGLSAGVICLADFLDLPGVAIVCYLECPEEYQIEGVENILRKFNIIHSSTSRPNTILNSNLYI